MFPPGFLSQSIFAGFSAYVSYSYLSMSLFSQYSFVGLGILFTLVVKVNMSVVFH